MLIVKEKIREKMKDKKLSISALEKNEGLPIHSIRNILKGNVQNPPAESLFAIEEGLEHPLLDFIGLSSSNPDHKNNIMNKKNNYFDYSNFTVSCANDVASLLKERALTLSCKDYFGIIKTLYFY